MVGTCHWGNLNPCFWVTITHIWLRINYFLSSFKKTKWLADYGSQTNPVMLTCICDATEPLSYYKRQN
jgi:hypothetical protein